MEFDWNAANIEHIALHHITPEEAEQVIEDDPLDVGAVLRNGEKRTVHLGETDAGRILIVVVTERGRKYRVVTARPSRRQERVFYAQYKAFVNDQDPTDP